MCPTWPHLLRFLQPHLRQLYSQSVLQPSWATEHAPSHLGVCCPSCWRHHCPNISQPASCHLSASRSLIEVIPGVCIKVSPSTTLYHSTLFIKFPTSFTTSILSIYLYILINTYLYKFIWVSPPLKYKFRNRTGLMCLVHYCSIVNRTDLFLVTDT